MHGTEEGDLVRAFALIYGLLFLLAPACGDEDQEALTSTSEEQSLLVLAGEAYASFRRGDVDTFYGFFSEDFQERCPANEFRSFLASGLAFVSAPLGPVTFDSASSATIDPVLIDDLDEVIAGGRDEDDLLYFWVKERGVWKADSTKDEPCTARPASTG